MTIFDSAQSVFVVDDIQTDPRTHKPASVLDLRAETCPMTLVKARLTLDRMTSGAVLRILINGVEPLQNLPSALRRLGFSVDAPTPLAGGAQGDQVFHAAKPADVTPPDRAA